MANADWNNPTTSSTYTNFVAEIKNRDEDLATMFDGSTATNIVLGTIKWSSANNRFEKWSGTAWNALTTSYSIDVTTLGGYLASDFLRLANGLATQVLASPLTIDPGSDNIPNMLNIKAGSVADHCYIGFYADSAAQTSRSGFIGYSFAGYTTLTLNNSIGNILLDAPSVHANGSLYNAYNHIHYDYDDGYGAVNYVQIYLRNGVYTFKGFGNATTLALQASEFRIKGTSTGVSNISQIKLFDITATTLVGQVGFSNSTNNHLQLINKLDSAVSASVWHSIDAVTYTNMFVYSNNVVLNYKGQRALATTTSGINLFANTTGVAGLSNISFLDSAGTSYGYIGKTATTNSSLCIGNNTAGADIAFFTKNTLGNAYSNFAVKGDNVELRYQQANKLLTTSTGVTIYGAVNIVGPSDSYFRADGQNFKFQTDTIGRVTWQIVNTSNTEVYWSQIIGGATTRDFIFKQGANASNFFKLQNSASTDKIVFDVSAGTGTASDWIATSDIRIKSNIEVIPNALSKIQKLSGYTFNKQGHSNRLAGIIAQELEKVLPEAVTEVNGIKAVSNSGIVALLISAINELGEKI